jgi:TolA protein
VNDRVTRPAPDAEKKKREELEAKEAERIERARQRAREEAEAREAERQARLEWERQMARKQALIGDLQHFAKSMGENETSTGIAIEIKGPGGGGLPYANFLQGVQHVYEMDWRPRIPQRVLDRGATATATVTIARDGTVVAARLTDSSGSREIDDSVRASLRAVTKTVPLPAGAEENERTVTIDFNVKPKQLRG